MIQRRQNLQSSWVHLSSATSTRASQGFHRRFDETIEENRGLHGLSRNGISHLSTLRTVLSCVAMLLCVCTTTSWAQENASTYFHEQVLPILEKHCFACHSHAGGEMEGGLVLDWRSGWERGGSRGPAIVPGDATNSLLLKAIRHEDQGLRMPEQKLMPREIAILTQWVHDGAADDRVTQPSDTKMSVDWWSLRPLLPPTIPSRESFPNPIDAFVFAKLSEAKIEASHRADRRTLIRRVYYDLTGLSPTFQEVEDFVNDRDTEAYSKLVDRLLASKRYGERWARHWLDAIHFADSHGYEHDVGRDNAWRFRDYVIESLNEDKSWERFLREQLATDYFYPDMPQLTPALGFLGAGTFDLSTYSTATVTFDYLDRDDLVTQTMAAFTSTTANCARCHSHKFDPIPQEDYYALQAVFAGLIKGDVAFDSLPETTLERRRLQKLLDAADRRDAAILLHSDQENLIREWLSAQTGNPSWQPLDLQTFKSIEGATLTRLEGGVLLSSGMNPERDQYVITGSSPLERISAIRLDVLPHESLPMNGPGRCNNGNLHLSEIEIQLFDAKHTQGQSLKIKAATADFNQVDWGIERAIDGDPKTAWGIHPQVGRPHYAVFELAEPIIMNRESTIAITLKQLHGVSHLIGALSLSATSVDPSQIQALPFEVSRAVAVRESDRTAEDRVTIASHVVRSKALADMNRLPAKEFVYAAGSSVGIPEGNGKVQLRSLTGPKTVHLLHRGDFDKPREVVEPGALSMFSELPSRFHLNNPGNESERRAALADWLANPKNVLTWRSIVNRVWHHHFGRGLCDTPSDFGRMGGVPSHPELLDWLAVWFRDDANGSLKALHRLIVTSDAYCRSTSHDEHGQQIDGDNRLMWRWNRQRLDADGIRDHILSASGLLDLNMGGPGNQHFTQSKGAQATPILDYTAYDLDSPGATRRSIYRYVWRGIADPFMEALDFPDLGLLSPVRGNSASSLQSLSLYNNPFVLNASDKMAKRIELLTDRPEEQVQRCVERIWLRSPSSDERALLTKFAVEYSLPELCRVLFNSSEFLFVE